jgi:hypothetical protein
MLQLSEHEVEHFHLLDEGLGLDITGLQLVLKCPADNCQLELNHLVTSTRPTGCYIALQTTQVC